MGDGSSELADREHPSISKNGFIEYRRIQQNMLSRFSQMLRQNRQDNGLKNPALSNSNQRDTKSSKKAKCQ
jgi:hypothetical protein